MFKIIVDLKSKIKQALKSNSLNKENNFYFFLLLDVLTNDIDENIIEDDQNNFSDFSAEQIHLESLLIPKEETKPEHSTESWILEKVCGKRNQIRIKNQVTGEYLYAAADDHAADPERRRVFTWTNTSTYPNSHPAYWERTADWLIWQEDRGFILKNVRYSEYLYAAADNKAFDEDNRSVFTWKSYHDLGQEGYWRFNVDVRGN